MGGAEPLGGKAEENCGKKMRRGEARQGGSKAAQRGRSSTSAPLDCNRAGAQQAS